MSDSESQSRGVAPLSVEADLSVVIDGGEAKIESTGQRLVVRFPTLTDAMRAFRSRRPAAGTELSTLLTVTDLSVEIRARDRIVAVAGVDARPGLLSRLLDLESIEVRLDGVAGAVVAEAVSLV